MRFCTNEGRIDLQHKGNPRPVGSPWLPWFQVPDSRRRAVRRIVFGHWSALGLVVT